LRQIFNIVNKESSAVIAASIRGLMNLDHSSRKATGGLIAECGSSTRDTPKIGNHVSAHHCVIPSILCYSPSAQPLATEIWQGARK